MYHRVVVLYWSVFLWRNVFVLFSFSHTRTHTPLLHPLCGKQDANMSGTLKPTSQGDEVVYKSFHVVFYEYVYVHS